MLCYTKSAKPSYINIDKQLDKKNKKNLEYINTKDVGLWFITLTYKVKVISQ